MNVQKTNEKGFTIIEVVLVLAIAALIFLMVFIALPALQRGQRDTQRKSDVARISTQVSNYASANRGTVPTTLVGTFTTNYLGGASTSVAGDEYKDPTTGLGYTLLASNVLPANAGEVGYRKGASCATNGTGGFAAGTANQYAVSIFLEGTRAPYCVDSK